MLLDTLGANLLGNILSRLMEKVVIRVGDGTISAGQHFQCCNIQIKKYFQKKFNLAVFIQEIFY